MFLLQCPKCKNRMKYQVMTPTLEKKTKKCVYCGHGFNVKKNIVKKVDS